MNSRQNCLLCLVVLIIVSTISERVASQSIITFNWRPYSYEENGQIHGFTSEIVQEIMKELQVSYPIKRIVPSANQIQKMFSEEKELMIFPNDRNTINNEQQYKWIGPIIEDTVFFYKKAGSSVSIKAVDDAKLFRVVCFPHGTIKSKLEQKGFVNLEPYSYNEIINKFIVGDADLIVCGSAIFMANFLRGANLPIDTLEQTPVHLYVFPMYIRCKSDISDEMIQKWQTALEKIKSSEKYTQIYSKYLNADY